MSEQGIEQLRARNRGGHRDPIVDGKVLVGYGACLQDPQRREGYLVIRDEDRSGHVGIFGTTRIGKTRLMESIIEQDIRSHKSVVAIDPKGDIDLFSKVVQVAAEAGRLDEVMLVTPIFPDYSNYLDPLANYYMEDELVSHIVSGIKVKDDYYLSIASEVSQVIVSGLIKLATSRGQVPTISFNDVNQRVGYTELINFRDVLKVLNDTEELCGLIDRVCHGPGIAEHFAKVSSSLRTMLSALTFGNIGRIIGKARTNEFITRLEQGKRVILVCHTGSLLSPRASLIFGRVFVSMIQSLVGRLFASGRQLDPPLCVHIDEGHNVLYPGIQEIFNKAGGANVWLHFYEQSGAQMSAEIGADLARSISDNINSWIYFRVNHAETAQSVEDASPLVQRPRSVVSVQGNVTLHLNEERLVLRDRVLHLPKRCFYMRTHGQWYKGKTLDSSAPYVQVKFPTPAVNSPKSETPPSAA